MKINSTFLTFLLAALCLSLPTYSVAQSGVTYPRVSLVTVDPGDEVYELEGHTGLRFVTDQFDMVVNWGVFDFNSPNFIYRFVKGQTDYMCVAEKTDRFLQRYRIFQPGRGVTEQVLPLDSVKATALLSLIGEQLTPENSVYRYNYVKDNCALRPLRFAGSVLGDSVIGSDIPLPFLPGATFRDVMSYYHGNYPWYQFGIDLALGSGIDYPLQPREYAFAPVLLREMLPYQSGTLVQSAPGGITAPPTPYLLTPDFVSILLALLIINISVFGRSRKVVATVYTLWFSLLTVVGCVLFFLVFCSSHEATSPNYNLLWINPLCILGTISIWIKKHKIVWDCYHFANFALVLAYAIVWLCGIQHGNSAFLPLLVADAFLSAVYIYRSRKITV